MLNRFFLKFPTKGVYYDKDFLSEKNQPVEFLIKIA